MTALSLYSGGCDGLTLAGSWVGMKTVAFCECDEACREQLHRRHPGKPIFKYDTEVTVDVLQQYGIDPGDIDIILASPPCQCASVAGQRLGAADERNRWPECLRIIRDVRPRWFVAENVPGFLSVNSGQLFGAILGELAEMGYDAGWCVYGAADVGASHQRDRLGIVAHRKSAGMRRLPVQPKKSRQTGGDPDRSGKELADAKGTPERGLSQRKEKTQPGSIVGSAMGNTPGGELRYDLHDYRQTAGKVHPPADAGTLGRKQGDSSLQRPQIRSSGEGRQEQESQRPDRRQAQPGLGGLLDGVSRMVAAQAWPAGRNQKQYDWEPPRTVHGMKMRAAMIKMYGNAVVPQWAVILLAAVVVVEQRILQVEEQSA